MNKLIILLLVGAASILAYNVAAEEQVFEGILVLGNQTTGTSGTDTIPEITNNSLFTEFITALPSNLSFIYNHTLISNATIFDVYNTIWSLDTTGGEISNESLDATYLRLDTTNSPLTGNLSLLNDSKFYFNEFNDSYLYFNGTNNSVQMVVHGLLETTWGQSVIFPRATTFLSDVIVEGSFTGDVGNISDGNLDVDQGNVTAIFVIANGSLLTDVCLSNGTNCNITTDDLTAGGGGSSNSGLFWNFTSLKTTGNITNGTLLGYAGANDICASEYTGSHMCAMHEIMNSINVNNSFANFTDTFRVSEGAPGFTANADDCDGWKSPDTTFLGSIWVSSPSDIQNVGSGALVSCSAERAIGCCI